MMALFHVKGTAPAHTLNGKVCVHGVMPTVLVLLTAPWAGASPEP
jgi:hypothetical protein